MMKIVLILLIAFAAACGRKNDLHFETNVRTSSELQEVSFRTLHNEILGPKCVTCHKNKTTEESLAKWVIPGKAEESRLFLAAENGSMPKKFSPLNSEELELIRKFILKEESFETLNAKILAPKCVMCHKSKTSEESLANWVVAGKPEESRLYLSTENGSMPKSYSVLTTEELGVLRNYITNFAPAVLMQAVTFEEINERILKPSCVACHKGMTSEAMLDRWINKENPLFSKFYLRIKDGSMPKNSSPLSPELKQLLIQYIHTKTGRSF